MPVVSMLSEGFKGPYLPHRGGQTIERFCPTQRKGLYDKVAPADNKQGPVWVDGEKGPYTKPS